jgi:hypothetical protein
VTARIFEIAIVRSVDVGFSAENSPEQKGGESDEIRKARSCVSRIGFCGRSDNRKVLGESGQEAGTFDVCL